MKNGLGCSVDYIKAIELYTQYHNCDYDKLILGIMRIYKKLLPNNKIYAQIKELYETTITKVSGPQLCILSKYWILSNGKYNDGAYYETKKLYELAIIKDYDFAYVELARLYLNMSMYDQAIALYEICIQKDIIEAYYELANMYQRRPNINYLRAEELYKQVIEKTMTEKSLNHLVSLYKYSYFKNSVMDIARYFDKVDRLDKLGQLYGFDEYVISVVKDNCRLEKENIDLRVSIACLETTIGSSVEGKLYLEVRKEWYQGEKTDMEDEFY